MLRLLVGRIGLLGCHGGGRTFCSTICIWQRGQWGNEGPRNGVKRVNYGNQGSRGEWGSQRGDTRRDHGGSQNYDIQSGRGEYGRRGIGSGRETGGHHAYANGRGGGVEEQRAQRDELGAVNNLASGDRTTAGPVLVELFGEQAAKTLYELKRQFKSSKSEKDRRNVQREARRLVRRARIDPSTQDEKSVALLLNCAATFRCYPHTEGIKQATDWMRKNIDGLSPQNVALFAHAVGALWVTDSDTILINEISPAVEASYRQMNPVEVVMILQAFQRVRIGENAELQVSLLQQLVTCIPQMPVQQLSTLSGILVATPLRKSDEAAWREISNTVVSKAVAGADKMHSREVITLLRATPHLGVPEDHSLMLVDRAIATVGFHTDEQIGELLEAVSYYRGPDKNWGNELNERLDRLVSVLWTRLQKVAPFADAASVTTIMRAAHHSGAVVPHDIVRVLVQAVMKELRYHRFTFRRVASLCEALAMQKAPARELLHILGGYCVGRRPPREDQNEGVPVEGNDSVMEGRTDLCARFLGDLTKSRIALENAHNSNPENGEPERNVCELFARNLERAVDSAPPRELLKCVRAICTAPGDCPFRNRTNDRRIITLSEQRIMKEGATFIEGVRRTTVENFLETLKDVPEVKRMVDVISSHIK